MNIAKEFTQFSQNANDETVRILYRFRDVDADKVIGGDEFLAKNDALIALATKRGATTWDETDCCSIAGLTMPPIPVVPAPEV
jgi:hypothetical protein